MIYQSRAFAQEHFFAYFVDESVICITPVIKSDSFGVEECEHSKKAQDDIDNGAKKEDEHHAAKTTGTNTIFGSATTTASKEGIKNIHFRRMTNAPLRNLCAANIHAAFGVGHWPEHIPLWCLQLSQSSQVNFADTWRPQCAQREKFMQNMVFVFSLAMRDSI